MKHTAVLYQPQQAHAVLQSLWAAIKPALMDGKRLIVRITPATKSREQEEKYHAMIGEIAAQSTYAGKEWDADDMKRILIDEFADAMRQAGTPLHHDGRLIPSENGMRVIQLGIQSKDFWIAEAANFIEFLYAWGADRSVTFKEQGHA